MVDLVGPIQHKRGTTAAWATSQIPLRDGEIGIDTTVRRIKVGDGSTLFPGLPWVSSDAATIQRLEDLATEIEGAVTPTDAVMASVAGTPGSAFGGILENKIGGEIATALEGFDTDAVPQILTYAPVDMVTNGDSLTAAKQDDGITWSSRLESWLGLTVRNPAVAGEGPNDISFRQGGLAPVISLAGNQIPTGTVAPIAINSVSPGDAGWRGVAVGSPVVGVFDDVLIAGVRGRVVHEQNVAGNGPWTFTPYAAPLVTIPVPSTTRMRMDTGSASRSAIHTIWAGRNYPDTAVTLREIARMVAFIAPVSGVKRFLVMTVVPSATSNDTASLNAAILAAYPANTLDIVTHLRTFGLAEAGITATSGDTTDIAAGLIPRSLRLNSTDLHLNRYGKMIVARQVALWLLDKGWVAPEGVFITAPAFDPTQETVLALPTASSSAAAMTAPTEVSTRSADFSWEVVFTPRGAVPTGPIGLFDRQSASPGAWHIYLYGNGNMRLQTINNAAASDFRDSTGAPSAFTAGQKAAIRIDYQASSNTLRMYRGAIDSETGAVTYGAAFYTGSMNNGTHTSSAAPLRLRGAAVDVEKVRILSFDRATVLLEEDFTDGVATGWALTAGAAIQGGAWAWA